VLLRLAAGESIGTLLVATTPPLAARKQWLADHLQLRGAWCSTPARSRLLRSGKSLLPIGVVRRRRFRARRRRRLRRPGRPRNRPRPDQLRQQRNPPHRPQAIVGEIEACSATSTSRNSSTATTTLVVSTVSTFNLGVVEQSGQLGVGRQGVHSGHTVDTGINVAGATDVVSAVVASTNEQRAVVVLTSDLVLTSFSSAVTIRLGFTVNVSNGTGEATEGRRDVGDSVGCTIISTGVEGHRCGQ
jgi:hypothetical protein